MCGVYEGQEETRSEGKSGWHFFEKRIYPLNSIVTHRIKREKGELGCDLRSGVEEASPDLDNRHLL